MIVVFVWSAPHHDGSSEVDDFYLFYLDRTAEDMTGRESGG